jgi:hypothetical protein
MWAVRSFAYPRSENRKPREAKGNNKLDRTDPPPRRYILLSAVVPGSSDWP